ncbi:MAG: TauD/TfdA family dioxygenase [Pseudomonadota bacterium]
MRITPMSTTLGATVHNLDLAQLNDDQWQNLYRAFLEYAVLVFPDQHLSDAEQSTFARRFGEIEKLSPKQKDGTIPISNRKADGSVAQPDEYQYQILAGNEGWHTDSTYMPLASKVAMLSAVTLPPDGGETEFADMRAAWEALPPATQTRLAGMAAFHSLYYSQEQAGFSHKAGSQYGLHELGAPLRPLMKVHPETGRKALYTGRHAYGIPGLSSTESSQLLRDLLAQACQPPRVYTHHWQVGDLVVWDNRCLLHRARPYDKSYPRVLRGSRIAGDPASELAPTYPDSRASGAAQSS